MTAVRDTLEESQEAEEQLDGCFQDQVIFAPEIMREILGYVDMRSLKQVRLVCKSWLVEAQHYMESRGIIRLWSPFSYERMIQLVEARASQIPTLPSPLQALDVDLYEYDLEDYQLVPHALVLLPSPLLTRFYPSQVSLGLVIQVVLQHASTLEYLGLHVNAGENGGMPLMCLNKQFPKLRHLDVDFPSDFYAGEAHFRRVVPWIINASPNLETFELDAVFLDDEGFISALVMDVDIKNVKAFKFNGPYSDSGPGLSDGALQHFSTIPFSRLQHFCLHLRDSEHDANANVWTSVVTRSLMTLQELEVPDELDKEDFSRVPVCPNVQRLHVDAFPYLKNFVPTHFPSLQALTVCFFEEDRDDLSDIVRLVGLKSLKIKFFQKPFPAVQVVQFFTMFPSLECLSMGITALEYCCMLISETQPSLNLLASIKHLEIHDDLAESSRYGVELSYSSLSILTGLESITFTPGCRELMITEVPLDLFPRLKLIQFAWDDALNMEKMLEMSRGVKKVWISNCCSVLRDENSGSKIRLTEFFKAARNAECSCKHRRMRNWE